MVEGESTTFQSEPIEVARIGDRIFVIRVRGRGSFQNCGGLKQFLDRQIEADPATELVIDLEKCTSMDSTFMGVLAGVGIRQRETGVGHMIIVNLSSHTAKLLRTLGLTHFLDVRREIPGSPQPEPDEFKQLPTTNSMSELEKIRMMIEAHEDLVDVDEGNEVKFKGVLTYLAESLQKTERAAAGDDQPPAEG